MARWTPDPSFYPSPESAAQAPPETLAYVATLNTDSSSPDAIGVLDLEAGSARTGRSSGASTCPTSATSCTTSAGTPARPRCARGRRTRTSSAATCSCPACGPRGSTCSTSRRTRARPKLVKVIEAEEIARKAGYSRPAHRPLRPRRDLRLGARQPRGRRAGRHLPARPRRLLGQGRLGGRPRPAGAGLRLLVAPQLRHRDHQRVGHAEHGRGRPGRRAAARQQVRPPAARLRPQDAPAPCRRSTSAPSTRWCSSCVPRTTRRRRTGSSASSPRPPT